MLLRRNLLRGLGVAPFFGLFGVGVEKTVVASAPIPETTEPKFWITRAFMRNMLGEQYPDQFEEFLQAFPKGCGISQEDGQRLADIFGSTIFQIGIPFTGRFDYEHPIFSFRVTHYFLDGVPHREDGPAYDTTRGFKEWRIKGKLHRVGGQAREGYGFDDEYYLNGVYVSKDEAMAGKDFNP